MKSVDWIHLAYNRNKWQPLAMIYALDRMLGIPTVAEQVVVLEEGPSSMKRATAS
jgi:hypothetical protein